MNLSICIPTYQRSEWLLESLGILLPEAQLVGVEVCVCDNATPDTRKIAELRKLAELYPCLTVRFQSSNVGLERNMQSAAAMAGGEYILQLGDDDRLMPGTLSSIQAALLETRPAVLLLDGWHCDTALEPTHRHLPPEVRGRVFSDSSSALQYVWSLMPFGSFICARDALAPERWTRYIGTSHAYVAAVWDYLAEQARGNDVIACSELPTVLLREGKKSWSADTGRIHLVEIPLGFTSLPLRYQSVGNRILADYMNRQTSLWSVIVMRAQGQLDVSKPELLQFCNARQRRRLLRFCRVSPGVLKPLVFIGRVILKLRSLLKPSKFK